MIIDKKQLEAIIVARYRSFVYFQFPLPYLSKQDVESEWQDLVSFGGLICIVQSCRRISLLSSDYGLKNREDVVPTILFSTVASNLLFFQQIAQ